MSTAAAVPVMVARALHGLVAAAAGWGVGREVARLLVEGAGDAGSVLERWVRLFSYFTIWSNVLVLAVSLLLVVRPRHDGPVFRVLRLDSVLCIVVTFAVYHTVLTGQVELTPSGALTNLLLHTAVPVGAVLAWLLAGPRPRTDRWTPAWALVLPAVWLAWTFVRGHVVGWYPYPFVDVTQIGLGAALGNGAAVLVGGALLGVAVAWLERRLPAGPAPA